MAAAILHDHLFDIDVIVNRCVVYLLLAATITAVYVATVVAVQLLFLGSEPPTSLITITALVLVSLIALPARDRLQLLADRMVFGRRSTPYHALATFAEMSAGAWSVQDTAPRLAGLLADATGASMAVVYIRADDQLLPVSREPGPPAGLAPVAVDRGGRDPGRVRPGHQGRAARRAARRDGGDAAARATGAAGGAAADRPTRRAGGAGLRNPAADLGTLPARRRAGRAGRRTAPVPAAAGPGAGRRAHPDRPRSA